MEPIANPACWAFVPAATELAVTAAEGLTDRPASRKAKTTLLFGAILCLCGWSVATNPDNPVAQPVQRPRHHHSRERNHDDHQQVRIQNAHEFFH